MKKYKHLCRPLIISMVYIIGSFQHLFWGVEKIYGETLNTNLNLKKSSSQTSLQDLSDPSVIKSNPTTTLLELPKLTQTLKRPNDQSADGPNNQSDEAPVSETFFYPLPSLSSKRPTPDSKNEGNKEPAEELTNTILINFNNVSIIEYIRFVSRVSNRNFVFDENDLQFNVTIVSEEPATVENIITALLQELRIHDLSIMEDDNNVLIHKNPKVNSISQVSSDTLTESLLHESSLITQVFHLNTLSPEKAALVLRPLVSDNALIEVISNTNHLIVTDLTSNVRKIAQLIKSIDAPDSGLVIGQYASRLRPIEVLIPLAEQIMSPISQTQSISFIPNFTTNSIFIVAPPFLVERTMAIMQYIDQEQASTEILNLHDLKMKDIKGLKSNNSYTKEASSGNTLGTGSLGPSEESEKNKAEGAWVQGADGRWYFKPNTQGEGSANPPSGRWKENPNTGWDFVPGGLIRPGSVPGDEGTQPKGHWVQDDLGNWVFVLDANEIFQPSLFNRQFEGQPTLKGGIKKDTKFYIHKLIYRRGDAIEPLLRQISDTLQQNEKGSEELINTLRSVQWLSTPNSLIFSGTVDTLEKVRALTIELDTPVRQVFIEMLILETTLTDSLEFGVSYGTRFGGGNLTGSQGFYSGPSPLIAALNTAGFAGLGQPMAALAQLIPDGTKLAQTTGFNLGVIGQKITHCGKEFGSIGALVNALHDRVSDKVVSNPKLLIEDNAQAEIFVGLNTPYRTQSISNDIGSVITSNYEYRDIGTLLKVTPYLGNGDIIALDISEEVSTIVAGLITDASTASTSPGPTTRIHRTATRVHIPDNYFLIISGMMQDQETRDRNQVPCLGAVPILGAAFSAKNNNDRKRNLMIFIKPEIIDTQEQINHLTKHQQDIYDYKNTLINSDDYETTEALELFNVSQTWHPEDDPYDEDRTN